MASTGKLALTVIILFFSLGTGVAASRDCRDCARSNLDSGNSDRNDVLVGNKPPARLFEHNDNSVPPISFPVVATPLRMVVRQVASQLPASSSSSSSSSASRSSTSTASKASSTPSSTASSSNSSSSNSWIKTHIGAIVGISIGAAVLSCLIWLTVSAYRRKARQGRKRPQGFTPSAEFYATNTATSRPKSEFEPSPAAPRSAAPSPTPSRYRPPSQSLLMHARPESAYFYPVTTDPRHSAALSAASIPPHPASLLTGPARMSLIAGSGRSWTS